MATALLVLALTTGGAVRAAPPCTITWDDGGGTGLWSTATNWNPNQLPGPADHVCIPAGFVVTHSSGTDSVLTITSAGTLRITAGTLNLTDPVEQSSMADFALAGGTIGGAGDLSVTNTLGWTGGTMRDAGTTRIEPGALLIHNGSVSIQDGRVLENAGRLEFQGAGWIDDLGDPAPLVRNTGTIEKVAAGGTATIFAALENDGSVRSASGLLSLQGAGGFVVSNGDFGAAAAVGTVRFDAGEFRLGDGARWLGGVSLDGSTVSVEPAATATASGANSVSAGLLAGTGTLDVTGSLSWTGGTMRGAGTTRIEQGAVLEHDGTVSIQDGRVLENAGRIEFQGAGWIDDLGAPAPVVRNLGSGTIEKVSADPTATIFAPLENDGSVRSAAGILSLQGPGGSLGSSGDFGSAGSVGTVRFDAGAFLLDDEASWLGGVSLDGSTVSVAAGAVATASGANSLSAGLLAGTGTLDVTGSLSWTGGTMREAGTTRIAAAGTVLHNGTVAIQDGRLLENAGRIEFLGAGWIDDLGAPAPHLRNTGTIEKTSADPTATIFAPLENDGSVRSTAGVLSLQGGSGGAGSSGAFGAPAAPGTVQFDTGTFLLADGARLLGSTRLDGGTVSVMPGALATASGANSFSSGLLAGLGRLDVTGSLSWTGGTMRDGGITHIAAAASVLHDGTVAIQDGRLLENAGRIEFLGAGWIDDLGAPAPLLHNTGTIEKTSADPTATIFAPLENDGDVRSAAGLLSLQGGDGPGSSTGAFDTAPGASVVFDAGTFELGHGARWLGGVNLDGATVNVLPAATATATGDNRLTVGILAGAGTFEIAGGTMLWTGGSMREAGTTRVAPGATLVQDGNVAIHDGRLLDNAGRFELRGSSFLSRSGADPLVHNSGLIEKATGSAGATIAASLDNDGTVLASTGLLNLSGGDGPAVQSGTFRGSDPGVVTFTSGTYDFGAGTQLAGRTRVGGGRLTIQDGVTVPATGSNELISGTIDGAGTLRIDGPFTWSAGSMGGAGRTLVLAGQELRLPSGCCATLAGTRRLENQGTLRVDGGRLFADQGTLLDNAGLIQFTGAQPNEELSGQGRLVNTGTITKTAGAATSNVHMVLVNSGDVSAQLGTLALGNGDGDGVQSGDFGGGGGEVLFEFGDWDLGPGSRFRGGVAVDGASLAVLSGSTLPVEGTVRLADGSLGGPGRVEILGAAAWTGGSMDGTGLTDIAPSAVLTVEGGSFNAELGEGHLLLNRGRIDLVSGDLAAFGATLVNQGLFDLKGDGRLNGGFGFVGSTLLHNTGTIRKSSGVGKSELAAEVDNDGTIEAASGTLALQGTLLNSSDATRSLTAGAYVARNATLELPGEQLHVNAATVVLDGAGARIVVQDFLGDPPEDALESLVRNAGAGELRLENGAELTTTGALRNAGLVTVGEDSTLTAGGPYLQEGGRTELLDATSRLAGTGANVGVTGGRLVGVGRVTPGLVLAGGEVSPGLGGPGTLHTDAFLQAGGTLLIETAAAGFDSLDVVGNAVLGGTLAVDTVAPFVPDVGATFRFVDAGTRTGEFSTLVEVAPGIDYVVDYDGTGATLRVAGTPAVPPTQPREPAAAPVATPFAVDDRGLAKLNGPWTRKSSPGFYEGTYTVSSRKGATLIRPGVEARYLGVLVSICRGCGTLEVHWDGRLLRRIRLDGKPSRRLVDLITFPSSRTGTVTLRVASSRRQVRVDGLVASK